MGIERDAHTQNPRKSNTHMNISRNKHRQSQTSKPIDKRTQFSKTFGHKVWQPLQFYSVTNWNRTRNPITHFKESLCSMEASVVFASQTLRLSCLAVWQMLADYCLFTFRVIGTCALDLVSCWPHGSFFSFFLFVCLFFVVHLLVISWFIYLHICVYTYTISTFMY